MPRKKIQWIALFAFIFPVLFTNVILHLAVVILPALTVEHVQEVLRSDRFNAEIFYPSINVVQASCQAQDPASGWKKSDFQELTRFSSQVTNGKEGLVTGLFVNEVLAYPVIQQPPGSETYVSAKQDVVTQFASAEKYGTIGLLAHNFLAGLEFFNVTFGQDIYVVYGDGSLAQYVVTEIRSYEALQPYSPHSDFVELVTRRHYTASDLFYQIYGKAGKLVLQTCITNQGVASWGRRFVIAERVN